MLLLAPTNATKEVMELYVSTSMPHTKTMSMGIIGNFINRIKKKL